MICGDIDLDDQVCSNKSYKLIDVCLASGDIIEVMLAQANPLFSSEGL